MFSKTKYVYTKYTLYYMYSAIHFHSLVFVLHSWIERSVG